MSTGALATSVVSSPDMSAHGGVAHYVSGGSGNQSTSRASAWLARIECGHCGAKGGAAVIGRAEATGDLPRGLWVRCNSCQGALAGEDDDHLFPAPIWGEALQGLPSDLESAYDEARRCIQVNAFTSSELMCRKLLMFVACDQLKLPEGKAFSVYVDKMVDAHLIAPHFEPFVTAIKDNANRSTHDLEAPSKARAELTLTFTQALLREVYELPHLMQTHLAESATEDSDA